MDFILFGFLWSLACSVYCIVKAAQLVGVSPNAETIPLLAAVLVWNTVSFYAVLVSLT